MFWSGNFIVVRELNFLLKEENVTLSQVLEADDILQECKADNKALMQFLTRPDILAELITLITEEPPKNVEISQQYRHASIACEVLTSPLSMLSDRLSLDTTQMNRLCDFINKDPPLNPLLASYFSKTVEMLLERNPKQDWYLYHIVCLRVLDFFKTRRDFLPNLLRHISTSAIADTFKYFIRLDDLFHKYIMEWLEEHQIIECLIQIICGTYVPEEFSSPGPEEPEKGQLEPSEKEDVNHKDAGDAHEEGSQDHQNNTEHASPPDRLPEPELSDEERKVQLGRTAAVASANAATLLCELIASGCAGEGATTRSRTSMVLVARLQSEAGVSALLQGMFTSSGTARRHAVVNGCKLLLALLHNHPPLGSEGSSERCSVELAVAPHLPLLHQALLHDPRRDGQEDSGATRGEAGGEGGEGGAVGGARLMTVTLLAHLALSEVEEVPTTLLTLGTPAVIIDMFFRFPNNNFLHAAALAFVRHALGNAVYRQQYATHLLVECDLLTRLMDAFEENENKQEGCPRSGYCGHVTLMLRCVSSALDALQAASAVPPALPTRWELFRTEKYYPTVQQYDTPLGGLYPSEYVYEDSLTDTLAANFDFSYAMATVTMDEVGDQLANDNESSHAGTELADSADFDDDDDDKMNDSCKSNFMELARKKFGNVIWDDTPEGDEGEEGVGEGGVAPDVLREVLGEGSPWDAVPSSSSGAGGGGEEGWAQFPAPGAGAGAGGAPDPFAGGYHSQFAHYWPYHAQGDSAGGNASTSELEAGMGGLHLDSDKSLSDSHTASLANNLLTAMSGMSPAAIANIVNANLQPTHIHRSPLVDADLDTDITGLVGDTTGLVGDATGLVGDATGLVGDATGLVSDASGLVGDTTTDLPVIPPLPSAFNANELQNANVLQQSSPPLDSKAFSAALPSSPLPTESKDETHTDSIKNDNVSSVNTEEGSNSADNVVDNTKVVSESAETPLEVNDTSER